MIGLYNDICVPGNSGLLRDMPICSDQVMIELAAVLVPILLIDALNPVLVALLVVAAGTSRPVANSSAFLTGHTLAYFVAGVGVAFGLERVTERLAHPKAIDFVIELIIGLLCLWAVVPARKKPTPPGKRPVTDLTPARCLGLGAVTNFVGVPFALPYFAAIDQILKANLTLEASLAVLAIYNIAYALPFAAIPLLNAVTGNRSTSLLERINTVVMGTADKIMPWLLFLLGIALVADSLVYFATQL